MKITTDKQINKLTDDYERKFKFIKDKPITLLEIGILNGGSLIYWTNFFTNPQTKIIGIDINIPNINLPHNAFMVQCNQNDSDKLKSTAEHFGEIDVLIDDGAHSSKETINSFNCLWPYVKIGGYYIIEDWAVGYWDKPHKAMIEIINQIIRNAPELKISSFDIVLDKNKAIAFFQKGEKGWQN